MSEIKARYEFRIWDKDLSATRKRLEQRAATVQSTSSESYFLSRTSDRCNAKVRNDCLDTKVLMDEYQVLERWRPALKVPFPISAETVARDFFPELNLAVPKLSRAEYEQQEFIDELIRPHPDLSIAAITKIRFQCGFDNCLAEFAQVFFNGAEHQTVVLESVDPQLLLAVINEFGLAEAQNLSYVRYLKRLIAFKL